MRSYKIVFWEFLLLFASVLIFRGFWILLDGIPIMNLQFGIWASLLVGMVLTLVSLWVLNEYVNGTKGE